MKDIQIEWMCDGWTVVVDDKRFRWDHNDEDMGTEKREMGITEWKIFRLNG